MTLTDISLPSELKVFVTQKVGDGSYASPEDLFTAAIRLLRDHEANVSALRESIAEGFAQIERGECVPFDADELKRAPRLKQGLEKHGAS